MTELLTTISIMFIVAGPFLLVANRFDLPTVPLLVIAGTIVGFFIDEALTLELAQYGIALLVFSFGVDIDLSAVRSVIRDSEVAALAQIAVVGSLGVGLGLALGVPLEEALFLGVAAALSSTLVGTALLRTEITMNLLQGRLAQSIHFIQDLLAILFVLVLSAETLDAGPVTTMLGSGLALLVAAVLVNRYLFDAIGRLAGDSDELMILGVVSLLAVFVGAAEYAGVSVAVGAFAAGLAVRHDPVEYLGLFNGLESIKDFFVAIFFLTVGALVVLPFVEIGWSESVEKLVLAGGLALLTVVVKPAITTAILLYRGYEPRSATLASLSSDQVSEFALIIAIEALVLGLLTQSVFDAIILAAAVTMIVSSLTKRYDERIYRVLADRGLLPANHGKVDELSDVTGPLVDHVIIVGYGRHGQKLVEACDADDTPYVVIENDPARREAVVAECDAYVFGDAMEQYTWEKANVDDASLVVSTIDSDPVSRRLLSFEFDADLTLRASDRTIALELLEAGALYVSQPDVLAGKQLVSRIRRVLDDELTPEALREEQLTELNSIDHPEFQHRR
ncbi:cation:proton antiporter [Natronolimnohabitans innermongolicus]|nr:cation:proton antiporter [Natronolimnohabitans innermongolicus]